MGIGNAPGKGTGKPEGRKVVLSRIPASVCVLEPRERQRGRKVGEVSSPQAAGF